jgi:serine/threonine protein kinase
MEPIRHRVRFVRELGRGTFGVAKLCQNTATNTLIVIKEQTLNPKDSRIQAQIAFEAQIMESLAHPNIVHFVESWLDVDKFCIAMEFCALGDLRQAIRYRRQKTGDGFEELQIRMWVTQLASALHYCHIQHILHRDLKAENVFVSLGDDGQSMVLKVADFGFARTLQDTTAFAHTRLGTPASLAPEITESSPYNNRADMWSVGVMLYELMTLRRPFVGKDVREVLDSILHDQPDSPRIISGERYSDELYGLCESLLSKDPKQRPSAGDVLSLPWVGSLKKDLRASESLRDRELEAWFKISFPATLEKSTLHLHTGEFAVNVRASSDTQSAILGVVRRGDVVEEVARVQPIAGGPVWFQLPTGYCIKNDASGGRIFRELPEWRIRRPNSTWDEKPPSVSVSSSPDDGEKKANEVLSRQYDTRENRLRALLQFLGDQELPENLVRELIDSYDTFKSTSRNDTAWTYFCVKTLRQMRAVHCARVLRVAIRLMEKVE